MEAYENKQYIYVYNIVQSSFKVKLACISFSTPVKASTTKYAHVVGRIMLRSQELALTL